MVRVATALSTLAMAASVGLVGAGHAAGQVREVRESRPSHSHEVTEEVVRYARSKIGSPYRRGGTGPSSFDCSGLVQWSYRQAGVTLKRTTYEQVKQGTPVSRSNLQPGDLVFFYSRISHVGIYVGDDKMIHAPKPGRRVQVESMVGHYTTHFHSARRVV
ncbi:C40 family peptidase [Actinorugispora endophytica]|uniref:NlpC/P60 family protein n=1 Tax=Actinorugispora endophytica TaxID=1605990 RepID=A0A4R6V4W8_9ACTN|nr:C40 family peptidase [Actinorugispora endophytica]TDQ55253.1 NlpC/P60 family protein [Actinorugispora endophytica]